MIDMTYQNKQDSHCRPADFDLQFKIDLRRDLETKPEFETWRQSSANNIKMQHTSNKQTRGSLRALEEQYYTKMISSRNIKDMEKHNVSNGKRKFFTKDISNDINSGGRSNHNPVIKTTVQNVDLECVKPQRAGVIIYTVVGESTYFGLGLDSGTHDLTDFGGGVTYKTDQNAICGAIREFEEETLSIFETIKFDHIKQCPVIYDNNNLIVFIHMKIDPDTVSRVFRDEYTHIVDTKKCDSPRKYRDPEVCGITWLTWEEFQRCVKEKGIMFSRVQRFLSKAGDFSYLL